MSLVNKIQTAFTGGELSPSLWNRPDLAKHQVGAKSLKNCFVHVEGGASNRPGTRFVHELGTQGVFIPFEFNDEQTYMLCFYEEAGQGKLMFLTGGEVVVEGANNPYIIDSPYAYADLKRITFSQQFDTLVLRHKDYGEYRLVRTDHAEWSFFQIDRRGGPYLPVNSVRADTTAIRGEGIDYTLHTQVGDVVQLGGGEDNEISAAQYVVWYYRNSAAAAIIYYTLRLSIPTGHSIESGDSIRVRNLIGDAPDNHDFSGEYSVIRFGADWVDINTGRVNFTNNYTLPVIFNATTIVRAEVVNPDFGFYLRIKEDERHTGQIIGIIQEGADTRFQVASPYLQSMNLVNGQTWIKVEGTANYDGTYLMVAWDGGSLYRLEVPFVGNETPNSGSLTKCEEVLDNEVYWRKTYRNVAVDLSCTSNRFAPLDVGRIFRMTGSWLSIVSDNRNNTAGALESDPIPAWGTVFIETGGAWDGVLEVHQSDDDGISYELIDEMDGLSGTKNYNRELVFENPGTLIKIKTYNWTAISGASNKLSWVVTGANANQVELVIEAYVDANHVRARVVHGLVLSFTTFRWEIGAFGGDQGQPGAVAIFQQRMFHARTNGKPMALWGSQTGNYTNHSLSNLQLDTEAIELDLSLSKQYEIRHMLPLKSLLILTSGSWHSVAGADGGLAPTNAEPTLHGYGGVSASVAPLVYGMSVLMVQDDDRSVSELRYALAADGYDRTELDVMSKHLFRGKTIRSWSKQEDPTNLVWVVMSDGSLLSFTFLREQEVWAWTPCDTQGEFFETGSVKSPAGRADEVYFLTKRTVGGQEKQYIEYLTDRDDGIFLDSSLTHEGAPATAITRLEHLEGLEVVALADGVVVRGHTVVGGSITLAVAASVVHVGLGYTSRLKTLPLDLGESTSSAGRKKVVRKVVAYVENSKGFLIGPDESRLTTPKEWAALNAGEWFSGELEHRIKGDWKTGGGIVIEQSDPLPMSIHGVVPFMELGE